MSAYVTKIPYQPPSIPNTQNVANYHNGHISQNQVNSRTEIITAMPSAAEFQASVTPADCLLNCLREVKLEKFYQNFIQNGISSCDELASLSMAQFVTYGISTMEDRVRLFKLIQIIKTVQSDGLYCEHSEKKQIPAMQDARNLLPQSLPVNFIKESDTRTQSENGITDSRLIRDDQRYNTSNVPRLQSAQNGFVNPQSANFISSSNLQGGYINRISTVNSTIQPFSLPVSAHPIVTEMNGVGDSRLLGLNPLGGSRTLDMNAPEGTRTFNMNAPVGSRMLDSNALGGIRTMGPAVRSMVVRENYPLQHNSRPEYDNCSVIFSHPSGNMMQDREVISEGIPTGLIHPNHGQELVKVRTENFIANDNNGNNTNAVTLDCNWRNEPANGIQFDKYKISVVDCAPNPNQQFNVQLHIKPIDAPCKVKPNHPAGNNKKKTNLDDSGSPVFNCRKKLNFSDPDLYSDEEPVSSSSVPSARQISCDTIFNNNKNVMNNIVSAKKSTSHQSFQNQIISTSAGIARSDSAVCAGVVKSGALIKEFVSLPQDSKSLFGKQMSQVDEVPQYRTSNSKVTGQPSLPLTYAPVKQKGVRDRSAFDPEFLAASGKFQSNLLAGVGERSTVNKDGLTNNAKETSDNKQMEYISKTIDCNVNYSRKTPTTLSSTSNNKIINTGTEEMINSKFADNPSQNVKSYNSQIASKLSGGNIEQSKTLTAVNVSTGVQVNGVNVFSSANVGGNASNGLVSVASSRGPAGSTSNIFSLNRDSRSSFIVIQEKLPQNNIKSADFKVSFQNNFPSTVISNKPVQNFADSNANLNTVCTSSGFNSQIFTHPIQTTIKPPTVQSSAEQRIRVCVRKRPRNLGEIKRNEVDIVKVINEGGVNMGGGAKVIVDEHKVAVNLTKYTQPEPAYKKHVLEFDEAFDESCDNMNVYMRTVQPLVSSLINRGGAAVCFAFGQTGAGKTYTLLGNKATPGLYELAANDIFSYTNRPSEGSGRVLHVWMSYYEIYCGHIFDLLNKRKRLRLREDDQKKVCIAGLTESNVKNVNSLVEVVRYGNSFRSKGSTGVNPLSSRSHAVLQIELRNQQDLGLARLTFIDLAGSERAIDSLSTDKQTRMEGAEINQSLLALKECIRSLDQRNSHTPYRQSKLTLILRDSFIGNCQTVMIANISPTATYTESTLNTLNYANRVQEIRNQTLPKQQQQQQQQQQLQQQQQQQLQQLQQQQQQPLHVSQPSNTPPSIPQSNSNAPTKRPQGIPAPFHPDGIQLSSTPVKQISSGLLYNGAFLLDNIINESPVSGHRLQDLHNIRKNNRLDAIPNDLNGRISPIEMGSLEFEGGHYVNFDEDFNPDLFTASEGIVKPVAILPEVSDPRRKISDVYMIHNGMEGRNGDSVKSLNGLNAADNKDNHNVDAAKFHSTLSSVNEAAVCGEINEYANRENVVQAEMAARIENGNNNNRVILDGYSDRINFNSKNNDIPAVPTSLISELPINLEAKPGIDMTKQNIRGFLEKSAGISSEACLQSKASGRLVSDLEVERKFGQTTTIGAENIQRPSAFRSINQQIEKPNVDLKLGNTQIKFQPEIDLYQRSLTDKIHENSNGSTPRTELMAENHLGSDSGLAKTPRSFEFKSAASNNHMIESAGEKFCNNSERRDVFQNELKMNDTNNIYSHSESNTNKLGLERGTLLDVSDSVLDSEAVYLPVINKDTETFNTIGAVKSDDISFINRSDFAGTILEDENDQFSNEPGLMESELVILQMKIKELRQKQEQLEREQKIYAARQDLDTVAEENSVQSNAVMDDGADISNSTDILLAAASDVVKTLHKPDVQQKAIQQQQQRQQQQQQQQQQQKAIQKMINIQQDQRSLNPLSQSSAVYNPVVKPSSTASASSNIAASSNLLTKSISTVAKMSADKPVLSHTQSMTSACPEDISQPGRTILSSNNPLTTGNKDRILNTEKEERGLAETGVDEAKTQSDMIGCHEDQLSAVTVLCKQEMGLLLAVKSGQLNFSEYLGMVQEILSTKTKIVDALTTHISDFNKSSKQ